jgi:hypothetical protein
VGRLSCDGLGPIADSSSSIDGEYGTDNPNHSNSVIAGHKVCTITPSQDLIPIC